MPTTKPRYTVTDSGELSQMLDEAQRRWPGVKDRKALLILLAKTGAKQVSSDIEARHNAVRSSAGALTGVYDRRELDRLRDDWPT